MRYDCVILPHFGGFVKHHIPACLSVNDGLLLPPREVVGFNPQLTLNDSLLVQSYVESYDYSYPEAQTIVEEEIALLQQTLLTQQRCNIGTIGTLTRGDDGVISFEPYSAGLLIPSLYALTAIEMPRQENIVEQDTTDDDGVQIAPVTDDETGNNDIVIRLSRRTLRRVAAVVIVLLLVASIPFIGRNVDTQELRSCINLSFLSSPTRSSTTTDSSTASVVASTSEEENTSIAETTTPSTVEMVEESKEGTSQEVSIDDDAETYTVILASMISERNALRFVAMLHDKYNISAEIMPQGTFYRVVSGSYNTMEEAQQVRRTLAATTAIADVWVQKRKNL